jgi:hypothetical protein
MLLAARFLSTPADPDGYEDARRRWQVQKYKTRDQEISYAVSARASQGGPFTGDPEIDRLLSMWMEPPHVAFV